MFRTMLFSLLSACFWALTTGCGPSAKLYDPKDPKAVICGRMHDTLYAAVRSFVARHTGADLRDTLILKYDYNNETCWSNLDRLGGPGQIHALIEKENRLKAAQLAQRPDVSAFAFREPGNRIDNMKRFDTTIFIDSTKQLLQLVFTDRSMCGNSIIVLPDQRYVFFHSDAFFEALIMDSTDLQRFLKRH